ncbi:MAG: HNH endonuclease [Planctomycetota bacterium]
MAADLARFLDLDRHEAAAQWQRIRRREPCRRQDPFLPVEVLLCYGLFRLLDPHRFGGGNIDRVPDEVKTLARTFVRTPGSITSKMLNLDGSRIHGARLEVTLFSTLADEPDRFISLYRSVLAAAREAGLGPEALPDFLGWRGEEKPTLLGQDEIRTPELDLASKETEKRQRALQEAYDLTPAATSRLVEQRVRLGQHRFARATLENYAYACGFCGLAPGPLEGRRLLVASHIKPWRECAAAERLDFRNGIAACPTHDVAFDEGLLAVNGGLRIHRARPLEDLMVRDAPAARFFGDRILGPRLHLPSNAEPPAEKYLRYHLEHVFGRSA